MCAIVLHGIHFAIYSSPLPIYKYELASVPSSPLPINGQEQNLSISVYEVTPTSSAIRLFL